MEKSEAKIQSEIVSYYHNNFCLPKCIPRQMIFHVPNQNQHFLMNLGVYPGVSDLVIIHNRVVYFFEVKEPVKGRQSSNQSKFEAHCHQCGLKYFVVHSLEEFKNEIDWISNRGEQL